MRLTFEGVHSFYTKNSLQLYGLFYAMAEKKEVKPTWLAYYCKDVWERIEECLANCGLFGIFFKIN